MEPTTKKCTGITKVFQLNEEGESVFKRASFQVVIVDSATGEQLATGGNPAIQFDKVSPGLQEFFLTTCAEMERALWAEHQAGYLDAPVVEPQEPTE